MKLPSLRRTCETMREALDAIRAEQEAVSLQLCVDVDLARYVARELLMVESIPRIDAECDAIGRPTGRWIASVEHRFVPMGPLPPPITPEISTALAALGNGNEKEKTP